MSDEKHSNQGHLVPIGSHELTTRSSALVRRGLEALTSQQTRIIRFPADRSMGTLYIPAPSGHWEEEEDLGEARGDVRVPAAKPVGLRVSDEAATDLSPLATLEPNDLQEINLSCRHMNEDQLIHLRGLTGLTYITLKD